MAKKNNVSLPPLSPRGAVVFIWRQLTSMETALALLVLLAVAAIPGSLVPQRRVDPTKVEAFLAENGKWGEFLDRIGMLDVYSSVWFSAIYLLLFTSLIGCVIPRLRVHYRQLRSAPPLTPKYLTRFTGYGTGESEREAEDLLSDAHAYLRKRHYRVRRVEDSEGRLSLSAERGYLRETGNLLFHLALVGVLVGVAASGVSEYRGQITLVEGQGFANSLSRYDSFKAGAWADTGELPPLRFTLDKFSARYNSRPGPTFGQADDYAAHVTVDGPDGSKSKHEIRVNEPLEHPGAAVFLLGNGYAPVLKVRDAEGKIVADGPVIAPPIDQNMTSTVVVKAPDAKPQQLALLGIFMPTGKIDQRGPHSLFPDLLDPQIALTVYQGDLGLDDGVPRNVYQVDTEKMTPLKGADGAPLLIRLSPGQSAALPGGGSVEFVGVKRFAAFDVAHTPFQLFTLVMALLALVGLALSLFIPRRRVWVRITEGTRRSVEVAGLARSDDYSLETDVQAFRESLLKKDFR
ncbi:cytochrome c biogenesis protein ResB [Dermabacteraceae bacterium P13264]|nr:cytochrome c biogenesis protein ResB [Dermabacteraceae bacterium TAE3-ERU5]